MTIISIWINAVQLINYVNRRFDDRKLEDKNLEIEKSLKRNRYLKTRLTENDLEVKYYSQLSFSNKLFGGLNSYVYLILKSISSHQSISTNLNLYKILKNSDFFDLGYYLKNKNLKGTRFYSGLNPILHYIFFGINENISINRKLNVESGDKKELLKLLGEMKK